MKCPHCGNEINIGSLLGSATSKSKARSSRENGKLGGRPKNPKRRPKDANALAHTIVAEDGGGPDRPRLGTVGAYQPAGN